MPLGSSHGTLELILAPWKSGHPTSFQGCRSPCGEAPTQPHQHRDSLGHHHDHWNQEGETTFPIVHVVEFSKDPQAVDLKNFLDIFCILDDRLQPWPLPQPLDTHVSQALDCPKVVPVPQRDDYSLVYAPNGMSDCSIFIYSLSRYQ